MQAAMLGTTFNDSNISRHPDAKAWGELAALVVAGVLLIALSRWTYLGLGFFLLTLTGFVGGSVYGFAQYGLLIDGLTISFLLLLLGTFRYSVKFISEFLEKQAIKKQFAGYASPTVVRMLQENPSLIKDGMKKEISICFSDLRGFTPLGESFGDDVKGLTKIMNGYMDAITQPILDADGMVIKYIGDASMHVHNAPIDDPNHPHTAVQCALDMLKAVEKFNDKITAEGRPPVGMGAGINTGLGYLGEMGSTQRHSYDVLGDSVSTAARIESKCKEYGMVLLIGEATYEKTKDDFFYLKLDDLAVKGKSIGISIYTVLDDVKSNWDKFLKIHRNMLKFYRNKQFDKAIELCNILTGEFDKKMDGYYEMWIERCEYMKTQDLPEDWNGVFIATTK
jgi:adenylate cyclase